MKSIKLWILSLIMSLGMFSNAQIADLSSESCDRGIDYFMHNDLDSAAVYFNYAVRANPKNLKAEYYLAKIHYQKLEYDKAIALFEVLQAKDWKSAGYSNQFWNVVKRTIAHSYYMSHLNKENKTYLKEALSIINSTLSDTKCEAENYDLKSLILTEMGKIGGAKRMLKKALNLDRKLDFAYVRLARLEKNKVKSIFYLSIGSHFSSGASMSKNRFDYEIKHTDVDYLSYLEKKSERFIEKLIKKNASNRLKCS